MAMPSATFAGHPCLCHCRVTWGPVVGEYPVQGLGQGCLLPCPNLRCSAHWSRWRAWRGTTFTWGFLSKYLNDSAQEWAMARVGHLFRAGPRLSADLCKPPVQCSLVPLKGLAGAPHSHGGWFLSKHLN